MLINRRWPASSITYTPAAQLVSMNRVVPHGEHHRYSTTTTYAIAHGWSINSSTHPLIDFRNLEQSINQVIVAVNIVYENKTKNVVRPCVSLFYMLDLTA
jgi:hypothetical protein